MLPHGTLAKPARGSARAERLAKRSHEDYVETSAKLAAKARDGHQCRRPGCTTNLRQWRLEAAHLVDQGMGGRHSVSADRKDYVSLCWLCHQGPRSVHSGDLRMVPLTDARGDGLVRFDALHEGGWTTLGIS